MDQILTKNLNAAIEMKQRLLADEALNSSVVNVAEVMVACYREDGKVLFCGNGGSAADAQHLAAELSGRYYFDREPLFAEALHVNTSYTTAVANDYSFNEIYARMVRAMGKNGDVLIAMSTSGNSPNVIRAIEDAQKAGMITVGMTGESGGKMKDICDFMIQVASTDTPRIQEGHMLIGHSLCEYVEQQIFGQSDD